MRGLCCPDGDKLLEDFLAYLNRRELSICNCSNIGRVGPPTFWPIDADQLVKRFVKEQCND